MSLGTDEGTAQDEDFRWEKDALGSAKVRQTALYGVHTVRALTAYPLTTLRLQDLPELVHAYVVVKKACALTNMSYGLIDERTAHAIADAADEILCGKWSDQFPTPVLQGGGGVSTNMNVNEVLANRAEELLGGTRGAYQLVHPNDHVNRSQSTNDTYPTAISLSSLHLLEQLTVSLQSVVTALKGKAAEYKGVNRLGRTCLRDAVPLSVEATHLSQAAAVSRAIARIEAVASGLLSVPLGATAVGTSVGAPQGFGEKAVQKLAEITGRPLRVSDNYFDALSNMDPMSDVAHAVSQAASVLGKIGADLRLLSSGPMGGFNEVTLPAISAGSSIMPGKTNPAIPELVMQVAMESLGMAHVVFAATRAGELELNVMEPVVVNALHPAIIRLCETSNVFARSCLSGLSWNVEVLERNLAGSLLEKVERSANEGYSTVAYGAHNITASGEVTKS